MSWVVSKMIEQYYTFCRRCGRQILMTRCKDTGRWIPCDPEIHKYKPAGGPYTYVTAEGMFRRGVRDRNGEWGYQRHRRDCA